MALGSGSGAARVPNPDQLKSLLVGNYELLLVTTEGTEQPDLSHWRFTVVPVDSQHQGPQALQGPGRRYLFAGTRTDLTSGTPTDSLRRRRFLRDTDFEMGIDVRTGRLQWNTAPGVIDGGYWFDVAEVTEQGFSGRWVDGGIAMALLRRDSVTVGEKARGYYCAFKRP